MMTGTNERVAVNDPCAVNPSREDQCLKSFHHSALPPYPSPCMLKRYRAGRWGILHAAIRVAGKPECMHANRQLVELVRNPGMSTGISCMSTKFLHGTWHANKSTCRRSEYPAYQYFNPACSVSRRVDSWNAK